MTQSLDAGRPARPPDMTGVPVGWYLDPDSPGARRYWDGRTWTASATSPGPAAAAARPTALPALSPQFGALVTTLQALLVAATLMHATAAWTDLRAARAASRALGRRDLYTAMAAHDLAGRALQIGLETLLVTGLTAVAFVTWLYLAHHNNRLDRHEVLRDPRWAVVGWLVPVLNFLRPLQVVLDVWHGATGPVKGSPRPAPRSVATWWGAWLVLVVLGEVAVIRSLQYAGTAGPRAALHHSHDLYQLLVPVLNFLRPLQVVLDVWHGATGPVKGSPRPAPRSVATWWGAWLVLVVLGEVAVIRSLQYAGTAGPRAALHQSHDLYQLLVAGHAAAVVAGLSAVLVVQQLSSAVRRAPVGGPRG